MRESNYGKRPPMSKRTKKMLAGMIGAGVMVAVNLVGGGESKTVGLEFVI